MSKSEETDIICPLCGKPIGLPLRIGGKYQLHNGRVMWWCPECGDEAGCLPETWSKANPQGLIMKVRKVDNGGKK